MSKSNLKPIRVVIVCGVCGIEKHPTAACCPDCGYFYADRWKRAKPKAKAKANPNS